MQDKEIDQLFRSEFENFEVEPSQQVWGNITDKLNANKYKKALFPYLSIAASILVMVAIGLYFIPQVKVNTKKPVQILAVKNNSEPKVIIAPVKDNNLLKPSEKVASVTKVNKVYKGSIIGIDKETKPVEITNKPTEQIAAVVERNNEILKPTVPDVETPLSIKTQITEDVPITKPNALVAQVPQAKIIAATPAKKHRINSLGDLINVVVSKVDKRKDKIIEFTNTEDDESTISGLNLGVIKIKKQE
ncbi:hypothetical protein [Mucilaginibacter sp.]|uniref:hypothetical protein n=1 Tax=Mucilaginibacter sp. TaxID=1882438 RepID=UPI00262A2F5C|nr:hypothetical protein [Mucilaginibacter sp.]MDB4918582.1 hypothetical protein [Mucilaginibacter sp.]